MNLGNIPEFLLTAVLTFTGTFAILKYDVKLLRNKNKKLDLEIEKLKTAHSESKELFSKQREHDQRLVNEKFEHTDFRREQLKDSLTKQMHAIDKKVTEIHTIIVTQK